MEATSASLDAGVVAAADGATGSQIGYQRGPSKDIDAHKVPRATRGDHPTMMLRDEAGRGPSRPLSSSPAAASGPQLARLDAPASRPKTRKAMAT